MREIKQITIFTGKDAFILSFNDYDKIIDETIEYENSIDLRICFYKNDKIVRELWNPSCDILYK